MPAQKSTEIDCPKCSGEGKIPLKPELQQTLDALRKFGPTHAADLKEKMNLDITPNGVSNRLSDLFQLRLVRRRHHGKFLIFTAK